MRDYLPPMFEGRRFATRRELHVYLAQRTGKTPQTCRIMLDRLGGDPGAVIAHYQVGEIALEQTNRTPVQIDFGGRTGADLCRYLAYHSGRSAESCRFMLRRLGGDPRKVLDYYAARVIEVSGRRFPHCHAFFRDLQQRFGISVGAARQWYYEQNLSPAAIEAKARELGNARRRRASAPVRSPFLAGASDRLPPPSPITGRARRTRSSMPPGGPIAGAGSQRRRFLSPTP
jgi:hypothetical protein